VTLALDLPVLGVHLLAAVGGVLAVRFARATPWVMVLLTTILSVIVAAGVVVQFGDLFSGMRALAWYLFAVLPVLLGLYAAHVQDWDRWVAGGIAVLLVLVGLDAFFVEPAWLVVRTERMVSDKVDEPLTIAILADLQTDAPGAHERRAIRAALRAEPDLILLPGDYIQHADPRVNARLRDQLRALLLDEGLRAPLGAYAVRGNVEHWGWTDLFEGTPVQAHEQTTVHRREGVTISALSFDYGFDPSARVPAQPGFHVAMAHAPDFALGQVQADLLVAGHTHGGQVQVPLLGPLITFSQVPNAWAHGRTELAGGRTLVVSRGIGMERDHAPRLRFWCRPEVVIVQVVPAEGGAATPAGAR